MIIESFPTRLFTSLGCIVFSIYIALFTGIIYFTYEIIRQISSYLKESPSGDLSSFMFPIIAISIGYLILLIGIVIYLYIFCSDIYHGKYCVCRKINLHSHGSNSHIAISVTNSSGITSSSGGGSTGIRGSEGGPSPSSNSAETHMSSMENGNIHGDSQKELTNSLRKPPSSTLPRIKKGKSLLTIARVLILHSILENLETLH